MAINVKKGPAYGLLQSDFVGAPNAAQTITEGSLVYQGSDGTISLYPLLASGATSKIGLSMNDANSASTSFLGFGLDSDTTGNSTLNAPTGTSPYAYAGSIVGAAGVIGAYALDGASVIETDQFNGSITAFTIGAPVYTPGASGDAAGKVSAVTSSGATVIGYVDSTRNINGTQYVGIKLA